MNYSTIVFLINKNARAVMATYETDFSAKKTMFKTLNQDIKVGDFCIVPTDTRHKMTVVKITDVDVNVDFDDTTQISWIITIVDRTEYDKLIKDEASGIETIKSAEFRKRRATLLEDLVADQEAIKALPIYANGK